MFCLGVDGGGTKTWAVVADEHGRVRGMGLGGPANPTWVSEDVVSDSLSSAIKDALLQSGLSAHDISFAYLGMASVGDREPSAAMFAGILTELGFEPGKFHVDNDAYVGMVSALGIGPGVCLVSGTGFNAIAVTPDGHRLRIPRQFLRHGPGWAIGREAAMIALLDLLGAGPRTEITGRVLSKLGFSKAAELLDWLGAGIPNWQLGQLAPEVTACADRSDRVALDLLKSAGQQLGIAAVLMARMASLDRTLCRIALVGGVFKAGDHVIRPLADVVRASGITAELVLPSAPPVAGSVLLAFHRAGRPLSQPELAVLKEDLVSK